LQRQGSVIMRVSNLVAGALIAFVTALLVWLIRIESEYRPELAHHYGIVGMGSVVVFAVVFRTNLGWQRYWEAMTQQHFMYSKWADAYSQFFAFATVTLSQSQAKGGQESEAKIERVTAIMDSLLKNFSLLSVFAADRLFHGDTQRMEERSDTLGWNDQVVLRKELGADRARGIPTEDRLPRMVLVEDLVGEPPSATLGKIAKYDNRSEPYTVATKLTSEEEDFLSQISDRVGAVMYWILHDLAQVSKDIDIAPPVQSRMYQELSNGMLGFNNSLKIADVPFPFPYAQLLTLALVAFSCFIPVYVSVFTQDYITSPLVAFFIFQGIWGVNEVAKELENPFGSDVNDISLNDFHERFVQALRETSAAHQVKLNHNAVMPNGKARRNTIAVMGGQRSTSNKMMLPFAAEVVSFPSEISAAASLMHIHDSASMSQMSVVTSSRTEGKEQTRAEATQRNDMPPSVPEERKLQESGGNGGGVTYAGSLGIHKQMAQQSPPPPSASIPGTGGRWTPLVGPGATQGAVQLQASAVDPIPPPDPTQLEVADDQGISTKVPKSLTKRERTSERQNGPGSVAGIAHPMELIDKRILEIGMRMEHQLEQIAGSVDALTQALAAVAMRTRAAL